MNKNWIKWLALGLTIGTLAIWTPTVVQAEESTDAVITEEVQDSEHEEATPDAPSTEDKMMEEAPEAPVQNATEDNTDITEDIYLPDNDAADVQLYTEQGAGSWRQTNGRWWFRFNDGTYAKGDIYTIAGDNYAFDQSGWMITGWYHYVWYSGDDWYYFNPDGKMHFGWLKSGSKWYYMDPDTGEMYYDTDFQADNDSYRFNADGSMHTGWYKDTSTNDWYYFDANGKMHRGWLKSDSKWYYMYTYDGTMLSDVWLEIDHYYYLFNADGSMYTGWYKDDYDDWYYFDNKGHESRGWVSINGKWYYFDKEDGYMFSNTIEEINGNTYKFNADGTLYIGWYKHIWDDGDINWIYFDPDGKMHNGWLKSGSKWYYFYNGIMKADTTIEINDQIYRLNADGSMHVGWYRQEWEPGVVNWYYFDADGKLHFGWFKADTKWYYAKPQNGIILSNTIQKIDGQKYRFDSDGAMHVGWYNDILSADDWYYFDANGMGHEGWLAHKGAWYYFIEGEMVRDAIIQTDSQFSRFGSDGKWLGYTKPLT